MARSPLERLPAAAVGLVLLALVGCSVRVPPTSPPAPGPESLPVPTQDAPSPTAAGPIARPTATVEQDGIRVTLALERSPMPAGEATWATVEVRNVGNDDLLYADPCMLVGAAGVVQGGTWRFGQQWRGQTAALKSWAMDDLLLANGQMLIAFAPDWAVDAGVPLEQIGCDAMLVVKRLAPGAAISGRAMWSGWTVASYAPPASGPVALQGEFSFYWRASEGQDPPALAHERRVAVVLEADVLGLADPPLVHPGEAIDVALEDPGFGERLRRDPLRDGRWYLRYVAADRAWHVARHAHAAAPDVIGVIDAFTGEFRATLIVD